MSPHHDQPKSDGFPTLLGKPLRPDELFLIAGPCVIESQAMLLRTAEALKTLCTERGIRFIFKSSYLKANRTRAAAPVGPGLEEGLKMLGKVREELGVDLLTDVHCRTEVPLAAAVVQVLQVPAFLCRQTPLLQACAQAEGTINVKKGQFLAPEDMGEAVAKIRDVRSDAEVLVTERGASFGYRNLVVDMRSIVILRGLPALTVYDVTHSLQHPGQGGDRRFAAPLARAALAAGAQGLFMEVHPDPAAALSDPTTQLPLDAVPPLLDQLAALHRTIAGWESGGS
ncbi:MAG: 3-deoxy-8-phosphooctulonate synthase [Candidatus Eisenbacteria bacterium]|nr:3-deoxy-8-phosphooctulonate synthase [Candidatus Eisenbacteria bacterium]